MSQGMDLELLSAADTTGSGLGVRSGTYNWFAYGTWDGASAQLQWSPNSGTTWIDIDGAVLTANGGWAGIQVAGGQVRAAVSSAGASTSLTSSLRGIA